MPKNLPPQHEFTRSYALSFIIETFDDPETGKPTEYGRFSRHWQDEEALDVLIDKLEAGQLSHKQALAHIPKGFKGQITQLPLALVPGRANRV